MSLPPGFLDELRTRTSIAQIAGRKVTWDQRKSNPGKGDYWAPCPFHTEKTASFHVDDQKGFYYCFGCHAKGDALSFVRETENMGFMDAVRLLADSAGMQMPAMDPAAAAKAEARKGLAEVMEQAVQFYRLQLKTGAAGAAREYLERRGLPQATLDKFEIGFAPNARTALYEHLTGKGVTVEELDRAGLCARPDDGGQPYDRFRDRIMFPIRDARGRAIAFGGRAMDPNARAKYLNSPETELFDKGRSLYNHGPAREAAGKAGSLIVAEGYMDVIALAQAGFGHAVAPLGTAITEDQLQLMWRITSEPVIALDGDKAGIRAAMRLVDLALPHLEPEKSLRFCVMPEGLDPDDLIKAQGPKAMADLLEAAQPMVEMLWRRETEGRSFDSPERRAALDAALRTALGKIGHPGLRSHYEAAIREKRSELFRRSQHGSQTAARGAISWKRDKRPFGGPNYYGPVPGTKDSLLAKAAAQETDARTREAFILVCVLNHPQLVEEFEAQIENLPFINPDLEEIRDAILHGIDGELTQLTDAVAQRIGRDPISKLTEIVKVRLPFDAGVKIPWRKSTESNLASTRSAVSEQIARQRAFLGHKQEQREAEEELSGVADEGLTWRLHQANEAAEAALRPARDEDEETTDGEKGLRDELQSYIDRQIWLKKKK